MKAITIKNPWAYLICANIKPIENRTWPTKYRGKVLIHSSAKSIPMINPNNVFTYEQWESLSTDQKCHLIGGYMPNSAIIGSVEIVDCVQDHPSIWAEHGVVNKYIDGNLEKSIHIWNWVLANPILFDKPNLNVKGKLSFWDFLP